MNIDHIDDEIIAAEADAYVSDRYGDALSDTTKELVGCAYAEGIRHVFNVGRKMSNEVQVLQDAEWEQRRYEIAKDAFCAILQEYPNCSEAMAQNAVSYADTLISELKKQRK